MTPDTPAPYERPAITRRDDIPTELIGADTGSLGPDFNDNDN
jgi:hypothetical protein